jgi:hypothetical protein
MLRPCVRASVRRRRVHLQRLAMRWFVHWSIHYVHWSIHVVANTVPAASCSAPAAPPTGPPPRRLPRCTRRTREPARAGPPYILPGQAARRADVSNARAQARACATLPLGYRLRYRLGHKPIKARLCSLRHARVSRLLAAHDQRSQQRTIGARSLKTRAAHDYHH